MIEDGHCRIDTMVVSISSRGQNLPKKAQSAENWSVVPVIFTSNKESCVSLIDVGKSGMVRACATPSLPTSVAGHRPKQPSYGFLDPTKYLQRSALVWPSPTPSGD